VFAQHMDSLRTWTGLVMIPVLVENIALFRSLLLI